MIDDITNRLQKEVTQIQKDMEKLESHIDAKLEKMDQKFQENLQSGLQQGLARISADLGNLIKQLIP